MRLRTVSMAAALLAAVACSEGEPGVLASGIVSGQNQTVVAGTVDLPDPVVQRIVRTADNRIVMYRVRQAPKRVLDFLVPSAYAQGTEQGGTVVNGSPVPGAVVCAEEGPDVKLVPFTRCTNTDANGQAMFFFAVESQRADSYPAEIRGTVENEPAVFDTAVAIVVAGDVDPNLDWNFSAGPSPALIDSQFVGDPYQNPVPFRIVSDGRLTVTGDTVGTRAARTVTFTADMVDNTTIYGPLNFVNASGAVIAHATYQIASDGTVPVIIWHVYGLNVTP